MSYKVETVANGLPDDIHGESYPAADLGEYSSEAHDDY